MNDIIHSKGLTDAIRAEIRELDSACSAYAPLCMKLNWDMLDTRPDDEINDLFYYENGRLVGYLGLYVIGSNTDELEITGMVHPHYRRRGIFTKLLRDAVPISRSRGIGRILLIAERQSSNAAGFAKKAGLTYSFSEYRMKCGAYRPLKQAPEGFSLRAAAAIDIPFLQNLDEICFGSTFPDGYERELYHLFVSEINSTDIGKIGLTYEGSLGYIFGVCILPEYRGLGYGRAMLNAVLKRHFDHQSTSVILEVATKNDSALTLYKSCGFNELTIYDYFELKL